MGFYIFFRKKTSQDFICIARGSNSGILIRRYVL